MGEWENGRMLRPARPLSHSRTPPLSQSPIGRVGVAVLVFALTAAGACSSCPGPVNGLPYEQQVLAWRAAKDASFRVEGSPLPAAAP